MNKYELVYIIAPDVDEEGRKALQERVNDLIASFARLAEMKPCDEVTYER